MVDAYVLYRTNLDAAFEIVPSENNFTATVNSITYKVTGITNPSSQYPNLSQPQDIDEYLSVAVVNNVITLHTKLTSSQNVTYQLEVIVKVGGTEIHRYANILLIDDNTPILFASQSDLFLTISGKYGTDYGIQQTYFDFYKSHLLSLDGTLDFSSVSQITSILASNRQSILKYLPNIVEYDFSNCTSLQRQNSGDNQFDFSNSAKLKTLNMSGCSAMSGTIDLSNASQIENIDLEGTAIDVLLPNNSSLKQIRYGIPTQIIINGAPSLQQFWVEEALNITNIQLTNIGNSNWGHGFGIFMYLLQMHYHGLDVSSLTTCTIHENSSGQINAKQSEILKNKISLLEEDPNIQVSFSGTINCEAVFRDVFTYLQDLKTSNASRYGNFTVTATNIYDELQYINSTSDGGQYIIFNGIDDGAKKPINFNMAMKLNVASTGNDPAYIAGFQCTGDNATSTYHGYILVKESGKIYERSHSRVDRTMNQNQLGTAGQIWERTSINTTREYERLYNSGFDTSYAIYHPLSLGADRNGDYSCPMTIYYFKYWKNDVLKLDCVPAQSTNGTIGLFDKVSGTFYTSRRNAFVAGPTVVQEEPGEE